MLTDYHTHTYRCGHATGSMRDYVEHAISLGIDEIALTDHLWLYFEDDPARRNPTFAMQEETYDEHFLEMLRTRDEFASRIHVRLSVEADFIEGREQQLLDILQRYPYDFVLGSVHFLEGWPLDAPESEQRYQQGDVTAIFLRYYEQLRNAVRLGCFDLLAHLDLPKKFGYLPESDIDDAIDETLDVIASSGVAVEVSSAGLRKAIGEIYPSPEILHKMNARSIPIAFSSDAHSPEEVGAGYDVLLPLVRAAGYSEIVTFEGRRRTPVAL